MSEKPLFQLRKELNDSSDTTTDANITQSFAEHFESFSHADTSLSTDFSNKIVLTENAKYTVAKLPASIPRQLQGESDVDGYIDGLSQRAVANNADTLYVWDYASAQLNPIVNSIPLHEGHVSLSCVPKAIITWPPALDDDLGNDKVNASTPTSKTTLSTGTSNHSTANSCGICIINRKSGLVQFYEDIETINKLSSRISKTKCHELSLGLKDSEYVTDVVNTEPAGILVSTTSGRLLFVTIRDFMGKPCLRVKAQLLKSHFGFFSMLNKHKSVVSIKPGPVLGKGERLVSLLTNNGDFHLWNLSAVANTHKRADFNVYDQILEALKDLYPCAHNSLVLLDSHPLSEDNAAHMILSSIKDFDGSVYYILTTIKLDEGANGFVIFSTYRLNTYSTSFDKSKPPRLLIPIENKSSSISDSLTSVYTVFQNAVVLTQVSAKLDQSYLLRRKWEDIISFRPDANIVGCGMDSGSIYLMSKTMGVIMITASQKPNELRDIRFIKSHIDQAVYFSGLTQTPINFNLPSCISLGREEIEEDLISSSEDILLSRSIYIPPALQSTERHLVLRIELYRKLLEFTKSNFFNKISPAVKIQLIEAFEILNCSKELLSFIRGSEQLHGIWQSVITSLKLSDEVFFQQSLNIFPKALSHFLHEALSLSRISSDTNIWPLCAELIISCVLKNALQDGEEFYRFNMFEMSKFELGESAPWYVQNSLAIIVNQFLQGLSDYASSTGTMSQHADQVLSLVKILYYICNQASLWSQHLPGNNATKYCSEALELYEENKLSWNRTLCSFDKKVESLEITEYYADLPSLAATLAAMPHDSSAALYEPYFEKFGYAFSVEVFANFISSGNLRALYGGFPSQHRNLGQFFDENPQYGKVGWMYEIFDQQYEKASEVLTEITMNETNQDYDLATDQTRLSIAKLCALVNDQAPNVDKLQNIQTKLDVIDGQRELASLLEQGASLIKSGETPKIVQDLFDLLKAKVTSGKRLSISEIIEMFTLLNEKDGFYKAMKLLIFNRNSLEFENSKFLASMIWRRCVLRDDWRSQINIIDTELYHTLKKCFDEKLFEKGSILPSISFLVDETILTPQYFEAEYGLLGIDLQALLNHAREECSKIDSLGSGFDSRFQSVIAASNDNSVHTCVIDYETGLVEEVGA
ncbi:LADA_0A01332g1_1 [Lachancea dasiensis]|uniref:LADA_0A01332g1_1 n=1 Tax=Lachancea dasiensis TaxID=1072105 RepID=A0A1G4IMJ7_9SACH|nr:LADA_0A01332g1_1 [Lachancea dasiensis]